MSRVAALALVVLLVVELSWRLAGFPGLHGDEAWVGLRALDMRARGFFTIHGMNAYSGALFPQIAAWSFTALGTNVFALRLPGALLNGLALVILAATFWRRGHSALVVLVLFASSLLFLFYGRVAWEVCALQNLLLALIVVSLAAILKTGRIYLAPILLFFMAFSVGTWNHFIFTAAAGSFALAAVVLALTRPGTDSARLLLLAAFNLPLQALQLIGAPLVADGRFPTHALPALVAGLLLVATTGIAFVRVEPHLVPWVAALPARKPKLAIRIRQAVVCGLAVILLIILPLELAQFFGAVSGYLMTMRVASYVPSLPEVIGLHVRMAVLVAAFGGLVYRELRRGGGDVLRGLLLFWAAAFLPVLLAETTKQADRHFIIPQFLFFGALALSFDSMPLRWRQAVSVVLVLGLVYAQAFFWREIASVENRHPVDYRYAFHKDTSRHFLKLDKLSAHLRDQGICSVESSSFFIEKPVQFLLSDAQGCRTGTAVRIEYCDRCRVPVERFSVTAPGPS